MKNTSWRIYTYALLMSLDTQAFFHNFFPYILWLIIIT